MGAGLGQAHGMLKAFGVAGSEAPKVAAVIGDSTFLHSGMTSLLNSVYNQGAGVIIILDNGTTAMTGRQAHPGSGATLMGGRAAKTDVAEVAKGLGVKDVRVVDPYELGELEKALSGVSRKKGPRVIVARRSCFLLDRSQKRVPMRVDADACTACGECTQTACPAISMKDNAAEIDGTLCTGCRICQKVCGYDAIKRAARYE
jgi:indolepyruvate ferredoxin oxidoreductase alpha subunit